MTLIGSTAAKVWFPEFRDGSDVDWHDASEPSDWKKQAREILYPGYQDNFVDERLRQWFWGPIATPDELYTMKVSHAYWEIGDSWNKHMADVVWLKRHGCEFIQELHDILVPIWTDIHGKKITNLNQDSSEFFADGVKRKFVHDSIHESIAYGDRPLYESILKLGSDVAVDSDRFFAMDYETQAKLVREEIYTTALERILIPNNYKGSPGAAYAWAVRRVITSLFKGKWATFVVLNYEDLSRPDCNYMQRHLDNKDRLVLI